MPARTVLGLTIVESALLGVPGTVAGTAADCGMPGGRKLMTLASDIKHPLTMGPCVAQHWHRRML